MSTVISTQSSLEAESETIFDQVWRVDFTAPGFAVIDIDPSIDSHTLRAWMRTLKQHLSTIAVRRGGQPFGYRSMGRFDQQVTTKFHIDGAPDQSLLMLGYEPSPIISRLMLADFTRAAFDRGITPTQLLSDFNPMYRFGEAMLAGYITELLAQIIGHSRIVLINNSSRPFTEDRTNSLGVMHMAVIVTPDESMRRIVNSTMLAAGEPDAISEEKQAEFVRTTGVSQRGY